MSAPLSVVKIVREHRPDASALEEIVADCLLAAITLVDDGADVSSKKFLAALSAAGYVVCPLEPTEAQHIAGLTAPIPKKIGDMPIYESVYRAMLQAQQDGEK